jgi:uncharacterized membrane protein required for colicin V production
MDWSLVIFLLVILFFGYRGYKKGLFKSIGRILSVLAGYVCAVLYTGQASKLLESEFQLQGVVAFLAASLLLFFGASMVVGLLFWLLGKLLLGDRTVSTASSLGGAAVGLATGTLLAIVIVWGFTFVRDSRPGVASATAWRPLPQRRRLARSNNWPTASPARRWLPPCRSVPAAPKSPGLPPR